MAVVSAGKFVAAAVLSAGITMSAVEGHDPFAFVAPDVVIEPQERTELDAGQTYVRVLPGRDGFLALSAIVRVDVTTERFVAWSRSVEALQTGKYVPEIGRFSMPPRLQDLRGLTIDPEDLDDLERCVPGKCGVKLSAVEIAQIRVASGRAQVEATFRQMLVNRAADYLSRGDTCLLPYHDHKVAVRPQDAFAAVMQRLEFFPRNLRCYADYLSAYPSPPDGHVRESFLYWSKETLGMKPIISITHFSAARFASPGMPEAAVVAKQVYGSHYKDAAVTVMALSSDQSRRYLVYVHRSRIDAFQGFFGGVVRRIVERRVKAEAPGVLLGLRKRFEASEPPQ